ncbi:hypothetical protein [Halobellus ordinarius]|uniref:hypothetical protein n=1 Tax=Halobellus ordinarius TaxID=3075120 RepID=UPI0028807459|nr:hypothetical protein [Halobellus sp. ZY16]
MSRFVDVDLGKLLTAGTPETRRAVFLGGLALLSIVNYLDLVGVLALGWTNNNIGWFAACWTLLIGVLFEPDGEILARAADLGYAFVGTLVLVVVALVSSPNVGMTYLFQATPIGQVVYAVVPTVANSLFVLSITYGSYVVLDWISEYRKLRQTTPEERVLEEVDND